MSEEKSKEKSERLDAADAQRKSEYEAHLAQQKEEIAARRAADEQRYLANQAQAEQASKNRYAAKKEARDRKDAEEEAAVQAEIAQCKANPKCTWDRVAVPLCQALKDKRAYQQDLAKEQANPSGFVNATYLHDLGAEIQTCDANIAMFRKEYREQMGRGFNEATCALK